MQTIKLSDIIPQEVPMSLSLVKNHTFYIKPISIANDEWLIQRFGGKDNLKKLLGEKDKDTILTIFFRLIDDESKKVIMETNIFTEDDCGIKTKISDGMNGHERLSHICTREEIEHIIINLARVRGISEKMIETIEKSVNEINEKNKKKVKT